MPIEILMTVAWPSIRSVFRSMGSSVSPDRIETQYIRVATRAAMKKVSIRLLVLIHNDALMREIPARIFRMARITRAMRKPQILLRRSPHHHAQTRRSAMRNAIIWTALAFSAAIVFPFDAAASGGNGMTWVKLSHDASFGIDQIGCSGCNAYAGETSCAVSRPVLCIRIDNSPRPPYTANPSEFYDGWARGHVATTMPIQGTALSTATTGDQICAATFGTGWRMARFHDNPSGGWGFRAYGNVRNDQRFWVSITDQPANCWNP